MVHKMIFVVVACLFVTSYAASPKLLWKFPTTSCVASTVAVGNGFAYAGTDGNRLVALNASTGSLVWSYPTQGWVQNDPIVVGNVVYFGTNGGLLVAVDGINGSVIWKVALGDEFNGESPLYGKAGNVFALFIGSGSGSFYAVNAQSGQVIWAYKAQSSIFDSSAVFDANDNVIFGDYSGTLYSLTSATGSPNWKTSVTAGEVYNPVSINGVVYVGTQTGNTGALVAVQAATGKVIFSVPTTASVVGRPTANSAAVFWPINNGSVVATDLQGNPKWVHNFGGTQLNANLVLEGSSLVVGAYQGLFSLSAADGTVEWSFETSGYAAQLGDPTLLDGIAYFGTCNGITVGVYAIQYGQAVVETRCATATCNSGCANFSLTLGCQKMFQGGSVKRSIVTDSDPDGSLDLEVEVFQMSESCSPRTPFTSQDYKASNCYTIPTGGSWFWSKS